MDQHLAARVLALGRVAIGTALLVAPRVGPGRALGGGGETASGRVVVRAAGVRDLVLGVGTLRALREGRDPAPWIRAGAVADVVDAAALGAGARGVGTLRAAAGAGLAVTAAALGFRAADEVEQA